MADVILTQELLKEYFIYDEITGILIRKKTEWRNSKKIGKPCGTLKNGYLVVGFFGKTERLHRLIWLYVYGQLPKNQIDHINGNRADNRISNLRDVTNAENCQNFKKKITNTSGYTGVWLVKKSLNWRAEIWVNYKKISLGTYKTKEMARDAYIKAKKSYHTCNPLLRDC